MADAHIKHTSSNELALRKLMLQQRSAVLRHTLAIQVSEHVAPALGLADRVVASGQWLKRHPSLLVGAAVALLIWRPKSGLQDLLRWAGRGLTLWQTVQRLLPVMADLPQRFKDLTRERTPPVASQEQSAA